MKLQFGIRAIAVSAVAVAIFCFGYRMGFERADKNRIDSFDRFMQSTVGIAQWEQVGAQTSLGGGISVLTTDGCKYYDIDASGSWIARSDSDDSVRLDDPSAYGNPFADAGIEEDPFR